MARHVLLTGVTGFVGKVVLETLLRQGVERVSVLVRTSKDRQGRVHSAQERFAKVAQAACFANLPAGWTDSVEVVSGDLEQPGCGVSAEDIERLRAHVTHVVHCAASVSFDDPYEASFRANVLGCRNALEFSKAVQSAPGSRFVAHVAIETSYIHGRRKRTIAQDPDEPPEV